MALGFGFGLPATPLKAAGGPSLALNFSAAPLDPRITFTRSTTATFTGSNGLIQTAAIDTPRFDYNPITLACKGLLIEEQRVNLLTYSEQFNDASWTKSNSTVTANSTVAPDGTLTADSLATTAANSAVTRAVTIAADSNSHTAGIFIKYVSGSTTVRLRAALTGGTSVAKIVRVNVQTGALVASDSTYSITSFGNGWYRITLTITNNGTNTTFNYQLYPTDDATSTNEIAIWGAQLESGAFATSYIPTVASQVTRTADNASMTGSNFSSWYNASESTFQITFDRFTYNVNSVYYALASSSGTTANLAGVMNYGTGTNMRIFSGGVDVATLLAGNIPSASAIANVAISYKTSDLATSLNGGSVVTQASGAIPSSLNQLAIGNLISSNYLNGHIKSITYYPRRMTNAELQAITT